MIIRNKKTGEIREVSKFELNQYGLGGQNNKLVKYQNKGEVKKLPGVLTRENIPGDALTSTAKREIVSIYPHYKNMETGFLKGVAYVSPDYKSQEDRELLFKRHRPVAYPSISGAVFDYFKDKSNKWFNTSMQQPFRDKEGDYEASEEAWRMTLGLPVKTKYIIPSKYRPLDEKDKTSRYYTLREDMYNKDLLRKKIQELNLKPGQSAFLPSFAPFVNESYMNQKEFSDVDPLQNFKIGVNKNGKMYFYDKYDFDFEPLSKVTRPYEYEFYNEFKTGGEMIKRADGSYSRRGLWDNIRANAGSGKKPTKEMLNQERKIKNQHQAAYGMEVMGNGGLIKYKDKGEVVNLNNPVNLKEIFIKANVLKQNPKPNFEHQINEWLGNTMAKAQRDAESEKWFNPKTKKWEEQDPIDNIRHASAGRYTAEAIANKTGNIPYISNTLGYLGSNLLGAAHEAGTYFTDPRWNNEKSGLFNNFKVITREALEDLYNNNMGAMIGVTPLTPLEKSRIIRNLSDNNLMPDGYGKMDPFHKGIKSNYQQGGQKMPPELAYARFAAAGNLNQLSRYGYEDGGEEEVSNLKNINLNLPVYRKPEMNPLSFNKFLVNDRNQNLFIGGINPRYQNENFSVGPYLIGVGNKYFQKFPVDYGVTGNYNINDDFNINMTVGKNNINAGIKYKFNNGGDVSMYGPGGENKPTTSDSLLLYNNQVLKNKFYKNNSDYTELPIDKKKPLTKNKDINKIINSVNEARKNVNSNMLNNDFGTNKSQKELSNRFGKIINSNVYSAGDIFSGKADTYFNPDSPASYFSNNILPKEWIRYFNNSDDVPDVTDVPMYDAIAIKPAHMKTPADWAYMKKTYGVTPTVQQTNTVNRQITTTAKLPVRTKNNLERLKIVTRPLTIPKVIPHGELIPVTQMKLKQRGNIPMYGPGNTLIGFIDDDRQFYPGEYTGAPNNQLNLQDKYLLDNPELLKEYLKKIDTYKFDNFKLGGSIPMFGPGGQKQNPPKVYTDKKMFEQANQNYTDSLNLYNLSNRLARIAGYSFPSNYSFSTNPILYEDYTIPYNSTGTTTNINGDIIKVGKNKYRNEVEKSLKRKIKPFGWTYGDIAIPVYKKPVQPVVYQPTTSLKKLEMVAPTLVNPKVTPRGKLLPVPSKQTVNLTNLIQPRTYPIDIYDRRGNFLRQEFMGDSEGVVDQNYIGKHHYAPRGGNSYIDTNYAKGGLVKYQNGEEVEQKNTTPVVNEKSKLIFRNPVLETPCEGIGCAQLASNELAKMNLIPSRTDAWFMGDAVVKDGGKQIWNRQSGNIDYSTLIPGDIITLDRPGLAHQDDMINNNPTGYTPEKEVEHVGVIVGHDERGVPLIKHGGNHGIRTVIQPIDKLSLYVPNSGITLNYKPFAIYRTKGAENIPIPDNYYNKQYAKFDNSIPLLQKQLDNTEKQNKMIDAFNNNLEMQSRVLGLNPYDIQQLQKIAFGIFGNESKYGTSPIQKPKEYTKRLAHFIRGEKWIPGYDDKTSASLSEMRIKYGDIYDDGNNKLGKQFDELGVKESKLKGFNSDNDYNDEANAAIAILVSNYNKIKNDKDEYGRSKYNYDPTKQTIYGDIPVTEAIAKMYNSGAGVINNENKLRKKPIYAKQAIENAVINFGEVPSLTKTFKNDVIIKNNLQTPLIKPVINRSSETILPENINPKFMYTVPPTVFAEGGGIPERYRNMGFTSVGAKKQSTRPGKKWMVLAKKGDDYKVVHGGYKGMQDFKQHHSEQRKENFWNRMGGRNSSKATDPFSPLYWHKRFGTWEYGGQPMAIGGQNMMNPIVKKDNRNWLEYLKN